MRWRDVAVMATMVAAMGGCAADDGDRPSVIACGVLGGADPARGLVWGWAQVVDAPPVPVRIEVNGEVVDTVAAEIQRDDLVEKERHPTGTAGFEAEVPNLVEGDLVRAFIDIEAIDLELTRSPFDAAPFVPQPAPGNPSGGGPGEREPLGWCSADSWEK